jgi:hypothetical protein
MLFFFSVVLVVNVSVLIGEVPWGELSYFRFLFWNMKWTVLAVVWPCIESQNFQMDKKNFSNHFWNVTEPIATHKSPNLHNNHSSVEFLHSLTSKSNGLFIQIKRAVYKNSNLSLFCAYIQNIYET